MLTQRVNMKLTFYIVVLFFGLIVANSAHASFANRSDKEPMQGVTSLTVPFIENQGQLKIKRAKYRAAIIPPVQIRI